MGRGSGIQKKLFRDPDPGVRKALPISLIVQERKRSHISLRLVGILKQFLGLAVTTNFPQEGGMATLTKYFNEIVPPCVRYFIFHAPSSYLLPVYQKYSPPPLSFLFPFQ
jgi:hypothetical protein